MEAFVEEWDSEHDEHSLVELTDLDDRGTVRIGYVRLEEADESLRLFFPAEGVDPDATTAFQRVANDWYNASTHPNIVAVSDVGNRPRPWLLAPEPEGSTFETANPAHDDLIDIVEGIGDGLRSAGHYNTRHLALHPGSIYLRSEDSQPVIDEWGLERACALAAEDWTPSRFSPPELFDRPETSTESVDIYGFAAVVYFLLTGEAPLPSRREWVPPAPPSEYLDTPTFDDLFQEALAPDPADRHDSIYGLERDLVDSISAAYLDDRGSRRQSAAASAGQESVSADTTRQRTTTDTGEAASNANQRTRSDPNPAQTAQPDPEPNNRLVSAGLSLLYFLLAFGATFGLGFAIVEYVLTL